MTNFELLALDYEIFLRNKIKARDEIIKQGYATGTMRKEFRIFSDCLGEFRKIAQHYREQNNE